MKGYVLSKLCEDMQEGQASCTQAETRSLTAHMCQFSTACTSEIYVNLCIINEEQCKTWKLLETYLFLLSISEI